MYKSLDKEILCEIIKDIDIKWTGTPLSVKEIEQILDKKIILSNKEFLFFNWYQFINCK